MSAAERRVYDALALRFGPGHDGLVWMKHNTIAELAGYTRRQTVGEAIDGLKDKGLIDVIDWSVIKPGTLHPVSYTHLDVYKRQSLSQHLDSKSGGAQVHH